MATWKIVVAATGIAVCVLGGLVASDQVLPSREYLRDDVQYFPGASVAAGVQGNHADGEHDDVLGKLLFKNVTTVWFSGPGRQFGGLMGDEGEKIAVYEHFIVRDVAVPDGGVYRTVYPYTTLGRIEQRLGR